MDRVLTPMEHAALPIDDGVVQNWATLNKATKLGSQKECSEQFNTDLRWPMSAWLLQQRFDTHGKTSLGASITDLPSLKQMASLTRSRTQ